jgi:hypothetical protein
MIDAQGMCETQLVSIIIMVPVSDIDRNHMAQLLYTDIPPSKAMSKPLLCIDYSRKNQSHS